MNLLTQLQKTSNSKKVACLFIYKYGIPLSLLIFLLGVFFESRIEVTDDDRRGCFALGIFFMALPLTIIVNVLIFIFKKEIMSTGKILMRNKALSKKAIQFYPLLMWFLLIIVFSPYCLVLNSLAVPDKKIYYEGRVIQKYETCARNKSYNVIVYDKNSNSKVRFKVEKILYEGTREGAFFEKAMYMGRFGIPFRWKISWPAKINNWLTAKNSSLVE